MLKVYYSEFNTANLTRGQIKNNESILGYKILFRVLTLVFGVKKPPEIEYSAGGKPYLSDHSYEFNISHSHGKVAVAVSDQPVGIDIESKNKLLPENICRRFFGKAQATAEEFTRFESYLKYSGEDVFTVSYPPKRPDVHFKSYEDIEGYVISVCSPLDELPDSIIRIEA